jgi:hypothetical protein
VDDGDYDADGDDYSDNENDEYDDAIQDAKKEVDDTLNGDYYPDDDYENINDIKERKEDVPSHDERHHREGDWQYGDDHDQDDDDKRGQSERQDENILNEEVQPLGKAVIPKGAYETTYFRIVQYD